MPVDKAITSGFVDISGARLYSATFLPSPPVDNHYTGDDQYPAQKGQYRGYFSKPEPRNNHRHYRPPKGRQGADIYEFHGNRHVLLLETALIHVIQTLASQGLSTALHSLERFYFTEVPIAPEQDRFDPLIWGAPAA